MRRLEETALVTGGGSGIGLAIARALAQAGGRVAIAGRRESLLREAAASAGGDGPMCFHRVDVTDRESVDELIRWADGELGQIDILVNAAGINIKTRSMADMTPAQWDQVMAINATGAYNCMYAVLPQMRRRGDGLIVNISSIAGKRAVPIAGSAYAASKFALSALSTAVGNEVAAEGIRVTSICPGEVNTAILDERPTPVSAEHKAAIVQPEDVADLVLAIACLPARAHVPELIIKPIRQEYA